MFTGDRMTHLKVVVVSLVCATVVVRGRSVVGTEKSTLELKFVLQ